jgi:hypothetical protein
MKLLVFGVFVFLIQSTLACHAKATWVTYLEPCEGNCTRTEKVACICPLDRSGTNCDQIRKSVCTPKLIEPIQTCKRVFDEKFGGRYIDADPMCIFGKQDAPLKFRSSISCNFSENAVIYKFPNVTFTDKRTGKSYENLGEIMAAFRYFANKPNGKVALDDLNF